eukprot:SAG11_NODE_2782_length_2978_cov_2.284126_1_plen_325_part_00
MRAAWLDVWHWLCGGRSLCIASLDPHAAAQPERTTADNTTVRVDREGHELRGLRWVDEEAEMARVFALAAGGSAEAVRALCAELAEDAAREAPTVTELTPSNAHAINPTLPPAGVALASMGDEAVGSVAALFHTHSPYGGADAEEPSSWLLCVYALTVLTSIAPNAPEPRVDGDAHALAVDAAVAACQHAHFWVRRAAMELLGRLGAREGFGPRVLSAMEQALRDGDRRVRRATSLALAQHFLRSGERLDPLDDPDFFARREAAEDACVVQLEDRLTVDEDDGYNRFHQALALQQREERRAAQPGTGGGWRLSAASALRARAVQ